MRPAALLVAAVAISQFIVRLSLPSVLDDRGFYLHGAWVLDAIQNGNWVHPSNHLGQLASKPPLYFWLAAAGTLAFGRISLFTMTLPSAVATLVVAAGIFAVGGAWLGKRAGLLGALAYLLSYAGAAQIALARPDAVFACAVTAAAMAAFRAWTSGRGWTAFWLAAAVATLAKGPLGLVLASLGLLAAGWEKWSGHAAPIRGAHRTGAMLFALITGGWFALAYLSLGHALVDRIVIGELLRHAIGGDEGGDHGGGFWIQPVNFVWMLGPWSLLSCVGFWRIWRRPAADPHERRAERFLFCWFLGGLVLFSMAPHRQDRHLLPIIPAAALVAGRELARLASTMSARALLGTCAAVAIAGVSVTAVLHHLMLDGTERVLRAQGMAELARSIRDGVGDGLPLTHVDTPFALQFFLNSTVPLATAQQAVSLLSGPEVALVAVRDLTSLRDALAQNHVPVHVVARWPAVDEPYVSVVSNHARLERTDDMAVVVNPFVLRTHEAVLVRRRGREFILEVTGPGATVEFANASRAPQLVRARIRSVTTDRVEERVLEPGGHWHMTFRG